MVYNNKYVKCVNGTGDKIIGVISQGGYHQDFSVPKGYEVRSAGWFRGTVENVKTFGESYGYGLYPHEEDAELISQYLKNL